MDDEEGAVFFIFERVRMNLRANLILRELVFRVTPFGVMVSASKAKAKRDNQAVGTEFFTEYLPFYDVVGSGWDVLKENVNFLMKNIVSKFGTCGGLGSWNLILV